MPPNPHRAGKNSLLLQCPSLPPNKPIPLESPLLALFLSHCLSWLRGLMLVWRSALVCELTFPNSPRLF